MFKFIIICLVIVYLFRLILKHNLFLSSLKINIKPTGFTLEIESKEKRHPSSKK